MDDDRMMRASDADRERVIERLRTALDEGRLKLDEYLDRMGRAAEAVTYGDLAPLYADLPATGSVAPAEPGVPPAMSGVAAKRGLPTALRVLWTIWAAAVSVNLVVWVLVCATTAQLIYPWPLWVACPWGAVLLVVSACVADGRRRQPDPPRLPSGAS
jgi:Domain of unknown function (DUF1707)